MPGRAGDGELRAWTNRPDGARLAVQLDGPRTAPLLLLLPGQRNSHHWWDRLRDDFARDWLTVTFDYRGTGTTTAPKPPRRQAWSSTSFAADAAAVIESLGRDSTDVYATSMGGRVAQELAIARPELVRRLVLGCTAPGGSGAVKSDKSVRRALADPDPDQRLRTTVDLFYTPDYVESCGGYEAVPRHLFGDPGMSTEDARRHLRISRRHDAWGRLDQIASPTLVMHGTDDRMTPYANAENLVSKIPGAELELVDGGRHGYFDESQDIVNPTVAAFLRG